VLFLVCLPPPAHADERILRFDSTIVVRTDGSLRVTEVITVRSEGDRIKRGIYRDFPTLYRGAWGFNSSFLYRGRGSAKRAAGSLPHRGHRKGKRVYIGDRQTYLAPDLYTYSLSYTTDFQLGFTGEYTELYWNVNRQQLGVSYRLRIRRGTAAARRTRQCHFIRGLYGLRRGEGLRLYGRS
jgi:hypothetical protein